MQNHLIQNTLLCSRRSECSESDERKEAVIGGEGNGGIIFPELHYGRDSLVGVALFLTHLAQQDKSVAELRATYPDYYMGKRKLN